MATWSYNNIIFLLAYGKQARNVIAHHDIDKQAESSLVYSLKYALVYVIFASLSWGYLQEKGTLAEIMDPEGSQYIQRNNTLEVKTPGFIVFNYHASNLHF